MPVWTISILGCVVGPLQSEQLGPGLSQALSQLTPRWPSASHMWQNPPKATRDGNLWPHISTRRNRKSLVSDKPESQTVGMIYELNILVVNYNGGKTHQTSPTLVLGILTNDHSSIYSLATAKNPWLITPEKNNLEEFLNLFKAKNWAHIQYNICIYYSFVVMMVALFEQCIAG